MVSMKENPGYVKLMYSPDLWQVCLIKKNYLYQPENQFTIQDFDRDWDWFEDLTQEWGKGIFCLPIL